MADGEIDSIINEPSEAEKRIKQLSGKVKEEAEAKAAAEAAKVAAEAAAVAAKAEAEFYKGFSAIASKYNGAAEKMEEIKAKVLAGYDLEDAAIAVTTRATAQQPIAEVQVAGGSAVTNAPTQDKGIDELSTDEKRSLLEGRNDELIKILTQPR